MKTSELRLGNYVNVPNEKQSPFRIDSVEMLSETYGKFGMEILKGTHPLTWYIDDLTPIPLSEEWLLKFGFKKENPFISGADMWQGMAGWSIENNLFSGWLFRGGGDKYFELKLTGFINSNIQYVHQLQNLYFALTGEELTLKTE